MGRVVNKKELSEIIGVSERTLTDWQDKGMPIKVDAGRGHSNEYDTEQVIDWRIKFVAGGEQVESMRERNERITGDLKLLELLDKSNKYLDAAEVEQGVRGMIAAAKSTFTTSARKLKNLIKREYEIDVELELFNEHIHATLTSMSKNRPKFGSSDSTGMGRVDTSSEHFYN